MPKRRIIPSSSGSSPTCSTCEGLGGVIQFASQKEVNVNDLQMNRTRANTVRFVMAALAAAVAVVVLAAAVGCSAAPAKDSVDAYSWDELSKIATEINDAATDEDGMEIASGYHLLDSSGKLGGKTKKVTLSDGTQATVMIAGIRQDDLADGGKAGITFVFADAPCAHSMNLEASNDGGWEQSEMRSWLNSDFLDMLPGDLKGVIKSASKKTNNSALTTPGAVSSTSDKLWLPSYVEIAGSASPNDLVGGSRIPAETYNAEGAQYQVFSEMKVSGNDENSSLARMYTGKDGNGIVVPGEACPWWQRSLSMTWTSGFGSVDADGNPLNAWVPDHDIGVVPGFCL